MRGWNTRRIARAAAAAALAVGFAACGAESTDPAADSGEAPCCDEVVAVGPLPDTSVWQLDSVWRDATGSERRLADLRGRVTLAAMIFTHCRYACPRIVADIQRIVRDLDEDGRDVRVLLVSMDHERDLPDVLAGWAARMGLDDRWTLLHGDAGVVRELAAVLGVRFKRAPSGDYSHSNLITVLDRDGVVVHRQEGLETDSAPTLDAIRARVRG